jgi:acetyl esterase/lipase
MRSPEAMSLRDAIDPEVTPGIQAYHATVGAPGLMEISGVQARREALASMMSAGAEPSASIEYADQLVPEADDGPAIRVRIYRPKTAKGLLPVAFFIHGGGMIVGSIESEEVLSIALADQVGCAVASIDYRLAPEHPHPAPVEDCYRGLVWLARHAHELDLDARRLAVYGGSSGGGLAAATTLLARDRGGPGITLQMLLYPMLDDRCTTVSSREIVDLGVWDRSGNLEAWNLLLEGRAGMPGVSEYAAPARASDLSGLPPAYLDVGGLDLFRDETMEYAARLMRAGVPTELHVYPGAVHSSEVFAPDADVSRRMVDSRYQALRRAFGLGSSSTATASHVGPQEFRPHVQ